MSLFTQVSLAVSQIGQFWQEKFISLIFRWNLFFIFLELVILFINYNNLPPQIPLFYSQPWGESQLAPVSYIFLLPALSAGVLLLNNCLAVFFLKSIQLLTRLLVILSLVFSIFATFALYQIINLVS